MKNIKIIFFDIDNTLLNHSKAQLLSIDTVRNKYFPQVEKEKFETEWLKAMNLMWDMYLRKEITVLERGTQRILTVWNSFGRSITEEEIDEVLAFSRLNYERFWEIFPQTIETLQLLRDKGYDLGILTNIHKREQTKKLQRFDALKYFNQELFFVPEEVGYVKPDTEFFLTAQKKANVLPENILFIGDDLPVDITPAKELGWNTILIDHFNQYPHEKSVGSFKELIEVFDA